MAVSHRSSHYWLWFVIFGVIPLIQALQHGFGANAQTYEVFWLLGAGLVGLLLGNKNIAEGKLAQPFDLIIGIIFTVAGVVGILGDFSVQTGGVSSFISSAGLSLGGLYPLLYTFLGLKSVHHGLEKSK
jgi:uncharacterized membrane protein HdeD (DUF308 family)